MHHLRLAAAREVCRFAVRGEAHRIPGAYGRLLAKLALEVQLPKRRVRLITGRVLDDGLAEALLLAHLTEAHLQPAAHNCAELAADLLQLVLSHLQIKRQQI